jgi:ABC-type sugar transport system permease subunit
MSAVSPEDSVRVKASGARVTVRRMLDREGVLGALLVTPAVVIVVAFLALPIGLAFAMAFIRIDLTRSPDWTFFGLGNFLQIRIDPTFFGTVPRTLYFAVLATGLTALTGSVTALFLNERFPGNRAMRVLVLLPWAVAPIATGVTWKLIFDYLYGLLNAVLFGLGLIPHYVGWLQDGGLALNAAIVGFVWLATPFASLIILTRLQGIPVQLYRAAMVDGANTWERFRYITFPALRVTLGIIVLFELIVSMQTFDLIYSLTKGGPGDSTTVINMLIYNRAFDDLRLGYASALALVLFALTATILGVTFLLARRGRRGQTEAQA